MYFVGKMQLSKLFIPYHLLVNKCKYSFVPTLFDRLPLPEHKFMGYWKVNQPGNAQQKMLCPSETQKIDVKVCLLNYFLIHVILVLCIGM